MKLTDLLLNRFLYKEFLQNIETKDSTFNSVNNVPAVVPPLASGGAAQDINTSNVFINGAQLQPGTFPVTVLDVSNWGWGQSCVFSSFSLTEVKWTLGVFTSASGETYNIVAGTTGAMTLKTYIYLDLLTSETVYQHSTTSSDAVGLGKVLVAIATPGVVVGTLAAYNLNQASQIVSDNILANTIDASKIVTGQLIVGTNVGLGTAQTAGNVTTIIGNTVTTGFVNALSVTAGSVAAENITGTYITGKYIRTASSGLRIQLDGSNYTLSLMNGANTYATLEPLYDGSSGSNGFNLLTPDGGGISTGTGGSADFLDISDGFSSIDMSSSNITYTAADSNIFVGKLKIPVGTNLY